MNDVDSFKDVKHHYLKFQQNRFSCSVLVERIFKFFQNFENFKNLDFALYGATFARPNLKL